MKSVSSTAGSGLRLRPAQLGSRASSISAASSSRLSTRSAVTSAPDHSDHATTVAADSDSKPAVNRQGAYQRTDTEMTDSLTTRCGLSSVIRSSGCRSIAHRSWLLPQWLREIPSQAQQTSESSWQRIVDALTVTGDSRISDLAN